MSRYAEHTPRRFQADAAITLLPDAVVVAIYTPLPPSADAR